MFYGLGVSEYTDGYSGTILLQDVWREKAARNIRDGFNARKRLLKHDYICLTLGCTSAIHASMIAFGFALKFILLNFQVDNSVLRSGYFWLFLTFVQKKLHLSIVNLQIHSAFGLHSSCDV